MKTSKKVITTTKIVFKETLANLRNAVARWNDSVDAWNAEHPDAPRQKVKEPHLFTAWKVYLDFIKKHGKGRVRDAKLRITHSNLQGEYCLKTIYNHILRLVQAGILKKSRAVMDFGKGLVNCIELKLDEALLGIEVEEKFVEEPTGSAITFSLTKLHLSDEKSRLRETVRFGDLLKSVTYQV